MMAAFLIGWRVMIEVAFVPQLRIQTCGSILWLGYLCGGNLARRLLCVNVDVLER